jgi:hypothetical protein
LPVGSRKSVGGSETGVGYGTNWYGSLSFSIPAVGSSDGVWRVGTEVECGTNWYGSLSFSLGVPVGSRNDVVGTGAEVGEPVNWDFSLSFSVEAVGWRLWLGAEEADEGAVVPTDDGPEVLVGPWETEGNAVVPSSREMEGHGVAVGVKEEAGEADQVPLSLYAEGLDDTVGFREDDGASVFLSFSSVDDGLDVTVGWAEENGDVVVSTAISEGIEVSVGRRENEGWTVSSLVGCRVSVGPGETDGEVLALSAL